MQEDDQRRQPVVYSFAAQMQDGDPDSTVCSESGCKMYCVFCGVENPEFASFCEKCGKPVNWKSNQPSKNADVSKAFSKIDPLALSPEPIPADEQDGRSDAILDAQVCAFQKIYSEMTDEDLLRLANDMTSLTEPALHALKSELGKRGLKEPAIADGRTMDMPQEDELKKGVPSWRKFSGWFIPVWFIVLLLYNVFTHWSQNADKGSLYILWDAIAQLTTPIELLLSAAAVYGILSSGRAQLGNSEERTFNRRLFSHPILSTVCILVGTVALLVVALSAITSLQKRGIKQLDNQLRNQAHRTREAPLIPKRLTITKSCLSPRPT